MNLILFFIVVILAAPLILYASPLIMYILPLIALGLGVSLAVDFIRHHAKPAPH